MLQAIRKHVYPQNTLATGTLAYTGGTLTQSFIPFSSSISSVAISVDSIVGTPSAIQVELLDSDLTQLDSVNYTPTTVGWNTLSLSAGDLVTKHTHYLRFTSSGVDSENYVVFDTGTLYLAGTLSYNSTMQSSQLCFSISVDQFILETFPYLETKLEDYPLVVLDVSGRPRVLPRWFTPQIWEEDVRFTLYIYSLYTDEIDMLASYIDKAIMQEAKSISNLYYIIHGPVGNISRFRDNVLVRNLSYYARLYNTIS